MLLENLTATSPIDGRYRNQTAELSLYFSEFALIKYRVLIEIEYFIFLHTQNLSELSKHAIDAEKLRAIYLNFSIADAEIIKTIEKTTNHDVKAVEYFIKQAFDKLNLVEAQEFVHFGLTSQDINNTAIPLSIKEALTDVIIPNINLVLDKILEQAKEWEEIPMLAKTHGQAASPTKLGKEWMVFASRIKEQLNQLNNIPNSAKFGGATGNFNAHHLAYPQINWHDFGNKFCESLGLKRSYPTTQIEHYDNLAALFDCLKRINTILIDFTRDVWQYVSMDYFKQQLKAGEIGSSAMPHKVNPIDFENAEGNLGFANAIFEHLSAKLPVSRLQRDLTDSTVLRNVGVPLAHSLIAFKSIQKGLNKLLLNKSAIEKDLDDNWAVVAEAIQTILRREGYPQPYEALKELTRTNNKIDLKSIQLFINMLNVSSDVKEELLNITPFNYTGA
ncbi:MAG: adenylosuccinate lyase [Bacteroidota bacterium]|jgi:adenylosuccinate lyase